MLKQYFLLLALLAAGLWQPAFATRRLVPQQYATVQAALNAAQTGDTVLVAPGSYPENLVFRGRNVVLASTFLLTRNLTDIRRTILDGSQPVNPDTASVIRIIHREGPATRVVGFTIRGGAGTKWPDSHIGGTYREGGGVLIQGASPSLEFNLIIDNAATNLSGVQSAGGGGIRLDGGEPHLLHNVIAYNRGRYGAGIVINYSGAVLRNNIIAQNSGGQDYGGGGIWWNMPGPAGTTLLLENNTIVGNVSVGGAGGGVNAYNTSPATVRNNLIWGNVAPSAAQVRNFGSQVVATYNNVEGSAPLAGTGNLNVAPQFADSASLLLPASPLIDSGDPASAYFEPASGFNPNVADFPAAGTRRADIGAYGGPGAALLPTFNQALLLAPAVASFGGRPVNTSTTLDIALQNRGAGLLRLDSIRVRGAVPLALNFTSGTIAPFGPATLVVSWLPLPGQSLADTVLLYHNDPTQASPRLIRVTGNVVLARAADEAPLTDLRAAPNPAHQLSTLHFTLLKPASLRLSLFDATGRQVWRAAPAEFAAPGEQHYRLPLGGLPAGLYEARLEGQLPGNTLFRRAVRLVVE